MQLNNDITDPRDAVIVSIVDAESRGDLAAIFKHFSVDCEVVSPATPYMKFCGYESSVEVLSMVHPLIKDVSLRQWIAPGTSKQVLEWEAKIKGVAYREINILEFDDDARISRMTVYFRPFGALLTLVAEIVPRLARRRGRWRPYLMRALLEPIRVPYLLLERPVTKFIAMPYNIGTSEAGATDGR